MLSKDIVPLFAGTCRPKSCICWIRARNRKRGTSKEAVLISALDKILAGQHLGYGETRRMCGAILNGQVRGALTGAALIGQEDESRDIRRGSGIPGCRI